MSNKTQSSRLDRRDKSPDDVQNRDEETLARILPRIPCFGKQFPQICEQQQRWHADWDAAHQRGDIEERERIRMLLLEIEHLKADYDSFLRRGLAWQVWAVGGRR